MKRPNVMSIDDLVQPPEPDDEPVVADDVPRANDALRAPARKPNRKATPETFRTSLYFHRSVHDALREIAYIERCTMSDLVNEGIDRVLRNRGRPSIKELRKKA